MESQANFFGRPLNPALEKMYHFPATALSFNRHICELMTLIAIIYTGRMRFMTFRAGHLPYMGLVRVGFDLGTIGHVVFFPGTGERSLAFRMAFQTCGYRGRCRRFTGIMAGRTRNPDLLMLLGVGTDHLLGFPSAHKGCR
jgi:hypothetical protein